MFELVSHCARIYLGIYRKKQDALSVEALSAGVNVGQRQDYEVRTPGSEDWKKYVSLFVINFY